MLKSLLDSKFNNTLSLRNIDKNDKYFPNHRCYLLTFKINLTNQGMLNKNTATLSYKNVILRERNFYVYSESSFNDSIFRMLFPFNLNADELRNLGLENLSLSDLPNDFEEYYKIKEMIDI